MKNVKRVILSLIVILSFLILKAGEEEQTIIAFKTETEVKVTAITWSENGIIWLRMYNLTKPSQFNKILTADQCNENNSICDYSVLNENLVEGNVYRIEMKYSGSSEIFTIQYLP